MQTLTRCPVVSRVEVIQARSVRVRSRLVFSSAAVIALLSSTCGQEPTTTTEPAPTTSDAGIWFTPEVEFIGAGCLDLITSYLFTLEPIVEDEDWVSAPIEFEESPIAQDLVSLADEYARLADDECSDVPADALRFSVISPIVASLAPRALPYVQFIDGYIEEFGVEVGCPYWPWWRWDRRR